MILSEENGLILRTMESADGPIFVEEERKQGWHSEPAKFEERMRDQAEGKCVSLVAEYRGEPAGYVHLYKTCREGPFRGENVPMIVDFAVLERFRRLGIGGRLMDMAEEIAGRQSDTVGLAVGLHSGYGSAQRMYARRGYIPDGSGVWYGGKPCVPYETVCTVDDDLCLFLSKRLRP